MPLSLDIVTPERVVLSDDGFDIVVAPGSEGELGILPRHAPLMTMLAIGELRARRGAEELHMAIAGGFLEVRDDRVTVLADAAERAEEIDIARAEAARRRAEESMATRQVDIDVAAVMAAARRAEVRVRVAQRRRRGRGAPGEGRPE
ncbi:MAG TPA: F0F1 ATP synthase subunit epsilon [Dehalococcoidia bacterium]|jgi:F-type H+-transporting ATPase subunit epsilon|nr:F0F1 ATP synthase subunit epsilon [Dehalococcoidia bacterium]